MKHLTIALFWLFLAVQPSIAQPILAESSLKNLDKTLAKQENTIEGLKPGNAAKIIWAANYEYKKSPIAMVYLHGFGASHREGEPVMSQLSQKYEANVYMARLKEHGIYRENTFEYLTPENYMASAKTAIAIGKKLGEKVIVVSTSTGSTLSLALAAEDEEIAGLVMYSPFIGLIDERMASIIQPGAKEKYIQATGSAMRTEERPVEVAKYWSVNYHVNGYVTLIKMLKDTMTPETFQKVNCPVFMGYYYKNEKEQDEVVSVAAMHTMFAALGTPEKLKQKIAFPESGNHVIACDLRSEDWEGVYRETVRFLNEVMQLGVQ